MHYSTHPFQLYIPYHFFLIRTSAIPLVIMSNGVYCTTARVNKYLTNLVSFMG